MKISEVIARWPKTAELFFQFGLGCVGCPSAAFETIELGALKHGLNEEEIEELVNDLNKLINKKKKTRKKINKKK